MEGKEVRFGDTSPALYAVTSTQTSTGSVDGAGDSSTPLGGGALLTGMMLGEVSPGGVGSGLYAILLVAIIAVFLGGLMTGRTRSTCGRNPGLGRQAGPVRLPARGAGIVSRRPAQVSVRRPRWLSQPR